MSDQEFKVRDRRHFSREGEVVEGMNEEAEVAEKQKPDEDKPPEQTAERMEAAGETPPPLPEVNFSTFVFSLSTSALVNLGELPDPHTQETGHNLPLAKQTIDILGMLQEKTQGNLAEDEENLLKNLLYELRMKYVAIFQK